jgi:hypothetical protein
MDKFLANETYTSHLKDYYLIENNIEPFPIQRLKWLENVFPVTKQTFHNIKTCFNNNENYLDRLTTMVVTDKFIKMATSLDKDKFAGHEVSYDAWDEMIRGATYNITFMYNWNLFKQVYKFDNDTFELLKNSTDIDKIPVDILKNNLPYPAFFIDNIFKSKYSDIDYRGCFVSLLEVESRWELGCFFIENNKYSNYHYCFVPLYFDNVTLEESMSKRDALFDVNSDNDETKLALDLTKQVLKEIIYICSINKEVETVKVQVANNDKKNKKSKKKPITVSQNYVGYKMGNTIRQNKKSYVYVDEDGNRITKSKSNNTKKSPHLRMAHYHHFWTGPMNEPEKRKLILKFIPPLYINSNKEEINQTTLHKVK